jgi:NADPH2:quinone reductase
MTAFEQISVYRLRMPLRVPYRLAFGPVTHFDTVIAEVVASDGTGGFGEATILTGYTDETIDQCWSAACDFADEMAANRADLDERIARLGERLPFTATAFGTALEMQRGSPLLRLDADAAVPLVGLLNAKDPHDEAAMHAEFERLLAAGFRTIKVKIGFAVDDDIALVTTFQRIVNGRALIRIDANQAYSAIEGNKFVEALDPAGIELFEQPCAADDWDAHMQVANVARATGLPMMLDESIYGMGDIERAAQLEAASFIKLKLMKLVTLDALARGIERIRTLGMRPVLGNGVACDPGCWMEGCIAARQIDTAGEMNGWLKATAPLIQGGLGFGRGAMRIPAGWTPRLDHDGMQPFLVASHDAARQVSVAVSAANDRSRMRAIAVNRFGGPDVLELIDAPLPQVGAGEALVKIEYAGINFIDIYMRSGRYARSQTYQTPLPMTIGMEGAGTVGAVGTGVTNVQVGDRVGYCIVRGSYAEYAAVPAWKLVRIPDDVPLDIATALMLQGLTAHYLTHSAFRIEPGHTALVHAGAGGVGQLLIQLAKLRGARVIATTGTSEKAAIATACGADHVILYKQIDFRRAVMALTGGAGVDVVYDAVGKDTIAGSIRSLKKRGVCINFGGASGLVESINPLELGEAGSIWFTRPHLADYLQSADEIDGRATDVFAAYRAGKLKVVIEGVFPFAEAAAAHRHIEGGKTKGKLLLHI